MKRAEILRKFDEIVAFADIGQFLDTPVKHYSSGMKVRLGFAVAAFLEPEILFIDEVLAVGDLAFQEKCLGKDERGGGARPHGAVRQSQHGSDQHFVPHESLALGAGGKKEREEHREHSGVWSEPPGPP